MNYDPLLIRFDTENVLEPFDGGTALDAGRYMLRQRLSSNAATSPKLSGGDIDAQWEMAESTGDETAGGSMPTPDQNVIDDMGEAIGLPYHLGEELHCGERECNRNRRRWELDPASSEDYRQRTHGRHHQERI